ncbi:hypothetical protein EDB19DRAFT_2021628 [Suillus lakei]|nr:hypothetical protein EDB19DRAFT_2021628 [Suillus lakei]
MCSRCGWSNSNGPLLNGIMVVLLIISYSSASLITPSFFACAGWGALVLYIHDKNESYSGAITWTSWSFFPDDRNFIYDLEYSFMLGRGTKGITPALNPLKLAFANPLCLVLLVAKPALHRLFGLYFVFNSGVDSNAIMVIAIFMFPTQIWNLCIVLFVFACSFTLVALRQPAVYGHLQALANLLDEWSPMMWWRHKEDGTPYCHARTSDHPLPAVKMDCVHTSTSVG